MNYEPRWPSEHIFGGNSGLLRRQMPDLECHWCRRGWDVHGISFDVDHVIPRVVLRRWARSEAELLALEMYRPNLVYACRRCNSNRGSRRGPCGPRLDQVAKGYDQALSKHAAAMEKRRPFDEARAAEQARWQKAFDEENAWSALEYEALDA